MRDDDSSEIGRIGLCSTQQRTQVQRESRQYRHLHCAIDRIVVRDADTAGVRAIEACVTFRSSMCEAALSAADKDTHAPLSIHGAFVPLIASWPGLKTAADMQRRVDHVKEPAPPPLESPDNGRERNREENTSSSLSH